MNDITNKINEVGKKVFCNPKPTYSYDELIFQKLVLDVNTYRGFHRVDKQKPGARNAFESILRSEKKYIIKTLINVKSEKNIDDLEIYLCGKIKEELKKNIKLGQLESFNKIRKPVDIIIEHLVAMCNEFDTVRDKLIKYLYLPLDSWIFKSLFVFSDQEIKELNIKRSFSFSNIKEPSHYYKIQDFLKMKVEKISIYNRISFDLIWGDRYKKNNSTNLFGEFI